jgi:hypothetical protein
MPKVIQITDGPNALSSPEPDHIEAAAPKPVTAVIDDNGKIIVNVPESRIPSGPPSTDHLLRELDLQEEINRVTQIAECRLHLRGSAPDSDLLKATDEVLWTIMLEEDERMMEAVLPGDDEYAAHYDPLIKRAIERTTCFDAEYQNGIPVLPEEVFAKSIIQPNLINRYIDLVEPLIEAPRSFILGGFMSAVSAATARKSYYKYGDKTVYLNTWVMLLGSSESGKGDAAEYAQRLLKDLSRWLNSRDIQIISDFKSIAGLLQAMKYPLKGSHPTLHYSDEIATLLSTSALARDVAPTLNKLYACKDSDQYLTKKPICLENVFLCNLACGTIEQMPDLISIDKVVGGFMNRWSVFMGGKVRANPLPPSLDQTAWSELVRRLAENLIKTEGEIELTPEAKRLYGPWHENWHEKDHDDAVKRTRQHAEKYACLYAILQGSKWVDLGHMRSGILLALFNVACMNRIAGRVGASKKRSSEDRARVWLEGREGHRATFRELHRYLKIASPEVEAAVVGLKDSGYVKVTPAKNKSDRLIELV